MSGLQARRLFVAPRLTLLSLRHTRQGWGPGKDKLFTLGSSSEDRRALKKSKEEGRLAEELLNRRSKTKSDRYC